jgi:hypothetical protein
LKKVAVFEAAFFVGAGDSASRSRPPKRGAAPAGLFRPEIIGDEAGVDLGELFEVGDAGVFIDLVDRRVDEAELDDRANVLDEAREKSSICCRKASGRFVLNEKKCAETRKVRRKLRGKEMRKNGIRRSAHCRPWLQ